MQSNNLNGSRVRASWLAASWTVLALATSGQALAWTGQPLAYVTSGNGISVIDTGDNKVVDTIPSAGPAAVTPDGKQVYAFGPSTSDFVWNVSVIDATNDQVVATVPLDVSLVSGGVSLNENSRAIAAAPDGKYIYVTTGLCSSSSFDCIRPESVYFSVWVIETATNKVVAADAGKGTADGIAFSPDGQHTYLANFDPYTALPQVLVDGASGNPISLPGNGNDYAIAITPDGRHLYVPYVLFNGTGSPPETVAVIDTATNTVSQTVPVEPSFFSATLTGVAVTPDGKYVYVSNQLSNSVAVIDTASNTVVKTVLVGLSPGGLAVTPDGVHVYVSNQGSDNVSVINAATNTVVATVSVPGPGAISIVPPPQGVPFLSFNAKLDVDLGRKPNRETFNLRSSLILSGTAYNDIHPDTEPVKIQVGPFITTIPIGSFRRHEDGSYTFEGVIDGVRLEAKIELTGSLRYKFRAEAEGANLSGITNPVQVSLGIGDNAGLTSVRAHFDRNHMPVMIGQMTGIDRSRAKYQFL
jgi:YVTN family beta-propeller protein